MTTLTSKGLERPPEAMASAYGPVAFAVPAECHCGTVVAVVGGTVITGTVVTRAAVVGGVVAGGNVVVA
jgi:hypothetical protein